MKEREPELRTTSPKESVKYLGQALAIMLITAAASASVISLVKAVGPSPDKYRMEFKTIPSKDGTPSKTEVKFIRQCFDPAVYASPSPFTRNFDEDCE